MVKRSTWIMIALLALVGGLYWYLQQPGNLASKMLNAGATPTPEILGTLISPDFKIIGFTLQNADGKSLSIAKENGAWMVTADKKDVADQSAAELAINQAQALELVGKIASAPDLAAFGLDQPFYLLTLAVENGTPITLKIGNLTVTGNGYYLQKEDGTVVVINNNGIDYLTNLLDQPPFPPTATPALSPVVETPTPTP